MPRVQGLAAAAAACLAVLALTGQGGAAAEAPSPTCAEGPEAIGDVIVGTPCDDRIVAPPGVAAVQGGGGDDTIVPGPITAAESCPVACHLDIGSQTFEGGPGNDIVYGERGNDRLSGGEGNDQLFGGIGDDLLKGGPGNDRLSGGFGFDSVDGEAGDDYIRGDATIDTIVDRGGGVDTLSYSTGITPGFFNGHSFDATASIGLPPLGGERGVYLDLSADPEAENGDNGVAPFGGGIDKVEGGDFEVVIGTAFSDYIVGTADPETIYGGGGGDVILGGDGADSLHGGADGDHLDGQGGSDTADGGAGSDRCATESATTCERNSGENGVIMRDPAKIAAGLLADAGGYFQLYLTGGSAADGVTATYEPGATPQVRFTLASGGPFDSAASAAGGCNPPSGSQLVCPLPGKPLDSLMMAGMGGGDVLSVSGFPEAVSIVLAGGEGDDSLTGRDGEDVLADGPDASGPGDDTLGALGGDDALLNNGGLDHLAGDTGNDLFLSDSLCDGDVIDGGADRDNASWTKFQDSAVEVRLDTGEAGRHGSGGGPDCTGGTLGSMADIEDLEGTVFGDFFYGDGEENQLLGWGGSDLYSAGANADRILANSGDVDQLVDCGDDADVAFIDKPPIEEESVTGCETVHEADPNNFRVESELEVPPVPPPASPEPSTLAEPQEADRGPRGGNRHPKPSCLAVTLVGPISDETRCSVRPLRLRVGNDGLLAQLRWRHWGSRRAVGLGRLEVRRGGLRRLGPAKVIASRPRRCDGRRWLTRLRVVYGGGYRRVFLRNATSSTPCANRLRRDGQR